ncbi:MAG: ABC transporter ATP-binding protein [Pseudomonadota bacterium]
MSTPVFETRALSVRFETPEGTIEAVRGLDLQVGAGETVAIVGASGSGKSQAMMAAMGLLATGGRAEGEACYRGDNLIGMGQARLDTIRGARITMIFQEPMTSLDPLMRIGHQLAEPLRVHARLGPRAARKRALELLNLVRIPEPERRLNAYPHELSGGQRQRVMIAMAIANNPDLIIADEPTTALDVTIQAEILALLARLQRDLGMALIVISHDLAVVRAIAKRVYVMRAGQVVEEGPTETLFTAPQTDYTRMLIEAEPEGTKPPPAPDAPLRLTAEDISVRFPLPRGAFRRPGVFTAVERVSLNLRRGQTLGIVGESGSGKSTLGRALLRLQPAEGRIAYAGQRLDTLERARLRPLRRQLQMVFQDPFGALSPRLSVGEIVGEGLRVHEPHLSAREREARVVDALEEVGLDPEMRQRFPHAFSGGQRQRIAIARAMILKPEVVVLDEPTSALDRSVQRRVIALLRRLQDTHALAYVFISHDLAVVRALSDHLMVLRAGEVVEEGPTEAVFAAPQTEYTRALMRAAFSLDSVLAEAEAAPA